MLCAALTALLLSGCAFAVPRVQAQNLRLDVRLLVDVQGSQRKAVKLEIAQVAAEHLSEFDNITVVPVYADDVFGGTIDAAEARQRLRQMLENDQQNTLLGMIGPFNLDIAHSELPVTSNAQLAVISPSLTDECLTQTRPYCVGGEPKRW